jgi:hypothetical protein
MSPHREAARDAPGDLVLMTVRTQFLIVRKCGGSAEIGYEKNGDSLRLQVFIAG